MGTCHGSVLGSNSPCKLELVGMRVYDRQGLQELLSVGSNTAYRILQEYGFRIGYSDKSPLRITEEGVKAWVDSQRTNTGSPKMPSNG